MGEYVHRYIESDDEGARTFHKRLPGKPHRKKLLWVSLCLNNVVYAYRAEFGVIIVNSIMSGIRLKFKA